MSIYRAMEGSGLNGSVTLSRDEAGFTQGSADLLFADGAAIRSELFLDEAFGYVPTEEEDAPDRDYPSVLIYAADLSREEAPEEPEEEAGADETAQAAEPAEEMAGETAPAAEETDAEEAAAETAESAADEAPAEETEEDFFGMVGAPALLVLELTDSILKVQRMEALFLDEYRPADADLTVYTLIAEEAESNG
ncbi:MAG: hypothetical protein IJL66_06785 [Lachnospiraceae bacterium]|nr:hypothetical protein [Lachnospiraceae bacterium]